MDDTILNTGLSLAMAFGTDWLKPIQERLSEKYPSLSQKDLDRYDSVCREAMTKGHSFIYKKLESIIKENKKITNEDLHTEVQTFLGRKYAWINSDNMKKLVSQGIYYAYKDGLHLAIQN